MLTAPKVKRTLAPEGTHIARCIRLIHIGTVPSEYMGQAIEQNKIELMFELVDELHVFKEGEDAKPFVVSREFTLSMGEKSNLRKFVEGVTGKSIGDEESSTFDVESLVNKSCLVTIKYKTSKTGNQRAEISSASPLMKGQVCKDPYNEPKMLTYASWDEGYFESLPDYIKEKIASSVEYRAMKNPEGEKVISIDETPF